jgi:cell division initiation protein
MKVTPLELRQRQFATVMRGYDRAEVNTILAQAADDYEGALLENERLRQELGRFEAAINEHRGQEKHLSNTLLTAQKLADDIRDRAQQDAARIISEAEGRAGMLVEKSQVRVSDVQREIDTLRAKRREVEASLEGIISTINKAIDSVREQDAQFRDHKAALTPPTPARDAQPAPKSVALVAAAQPNRAS